jgi:hypothetical protein
VRWLSGNHGKYLYAVHKWALWDPPDLRAAYPTEFDWRHCVTYLDEQEAVDAAFRLANNVSIWPDIRHEFGTLNAGEPETKESERY